MSVELWNVLHDASIIKVRPDAGNVVLTIEIEYLLERFSDQPTHLVVTLLDCEVFCYTPFDGQATTDYGEIEKTVPEILSAESRGFSITVILVDGMLETRYRDSRIVTPTGREIELAELFRVAEQYWDDFEARGRAKQS